jgi:hypothetical protein
VRATPRQVAAVAALVAAAFGPGAACLPDAEPENAHALALGRPFNRVEIGGDAGGGAPWVLYSRTNEDRSDVAALWSVPFEGGATRLLTEKRLLSVPVAFQSDGSVLVQHDPRLLPSGSPNRPWLVAALARIVLATGEVAEDNAEVQTFGAAPSRFFFRRAKADTSETQLVVSEGGSKRRDLGPAWGPRFGHGDSVFFVQPQDNGLARLRDVSSNPEKLQSDVSEFSLSPDGRWLVLQKIGTEMESGQRMVVPLDTLNAKPLMFPHPCKALGFAPASDRFSCGYREPTTGATRLEVADLNAPANHDLFELPTSDANFAEVAWRPDEQVGLAVAASARSPSIVIRPNGEPRVQSFGPVVYPAVFTGDGRHLLYVRPDVMPAPGGNEATGPLMIADGDLATPGRPLSPDGYMVAGFALLEGDEVLITAVSYSGASVDLFVAPLGGGPARLLASHVIEVMPSGRRVLALVRYNGQDRTSDLVLYDRAADREVPLADSVVDFAVGLPPDGGPALGPGAPVAFILRDRAPTTREGVWATRLP